MSSKRGSFWIILITASLSSNDIRQRFMLKARASGGTQSMLQIVHELRPSRLHFLAAVLKLQSYHLMQVYAWKAPSLNLCVTPLIVLREAVVCFLTDPCDCQRCATRLLTWKVLFASLPNDVTSIALASCRTTSPFCGGSRWTVHCPQ